MATSKNKPEPITFVVQGQLLQAAATRGGGAATAVAAADPDAARIKGSVRVGAARAGGEPVRLVAVPGQDIVRLRIEGGPTLRLHPETARELLQGPPGAQARRSRGRAAGGGGGGGREVYVEPELSWPGLESALPATRGGGILAKIKLAFIDVLGGALVDKAADFTAAKVTDWLDSRVRPGVYKLPREGELFRLKERDDLRIKGEIQPPAGGKPILVLVHGTFVETQSTFGKLWARHPLQAQALYDRYEGAVYALDHATLGDSPFTNAQVLADALPKGARVHLLTHSRGGLVAEVLARLADMPALDKEDAAFFIGAHAAQAEQMRRLHARLRQQQVQIERVVRVACPARGTLLASKRLDVYLSVLAWLLERAGVEPIAELVKFLDAVAERRTDPRLIPGLEAMMPTSPIVQWLNQPRAGIKGELRVVAGDLKADSVGSFFKTLLADAFYWTDNDIVVHTSSMYGGTPRTGGASFVLDRSGEASHFAYFANAFTVRAVVEGLTQTSPALYRTIGPLSWAGDSSDGVRGARAVTRGRARGAEPAVEPGHRPAVLVLPGILGSNLQVGGHRIWLGPRLLGGLGQLAYQPGGADGVEPDGPISLVYNKLIEHLQKSHDVVAFDFDWRRPIEEEADRLADEVKAQLDARVASGQPVRLLVHSMGGLVARTMQIVRPEVWQRLMAHREARLLMLGTPNGGSWAPMQMLSGDDTFGNTLVAVGAPFSDHKTRMMMAQFPGFIQLQAGLTDPALALDRHETWDKLARDDLEQMQQRAWWHRTWLQDEGPADPQLAVYQWGVPAQGVLDQARRLREKLDAQRDRVLPAFATKMLLVVGRSKFTPDGFELRGDEGFVYRNAVDGGDGRVPLPSARLAGVKTWLLDEEHGSLPSATSAFAAFEELLDKGDTDKLQRLDGGATTRGRTDTAAAMAAPGIVYSRPSRARRPAEPVGSEDEVLAQGAVAAPPTAAGAAEPGAPLAVRMVNGNLAFVRVPLFIGHYQSLGLAGTEAVVDRLVGGTMRAALALNAGHYPEGVGTHQVFVNTLRDEAEPTRPARPLAAIVVGLGEEGKLRAAALTTTVRQAVLAWLQRRHEERAQGGDAGPVHIAATLVGSGGIGISAGASARAIVQGVVDANRRVVDNANGWPAVEELELVELYHDRATEAWRELRELHDVRDDGGGAFTLAPTIEAGSGALRRPLDSGYRGAEYDFIRVSGRGGGRIEFALDTRRARTELREQSTQVALVQELVATAASDSHSDDQLGRTLFQLLVPPAIEPYLSGNGRFLLELDPSVADIPWEMLDTRPSEREQGREADHRPWALRCGLLRKLQLPADAGPGRRDAIADDSILVIGEPQVTKQGYGELVGAVEEAQAVAGMFERTAGFGNQRVELHLQKSARPIINALYARDWRIVHVSGHGEPGELGGVVLSGEAFLGPNEIAAMRTVPEFVFVNCCNLANLRPDEKPHPKRAEFKPGAFAAGVAAALIRVGVRCVVAAGWNVADDAAKVFALRLYERLLAGASFGRAVADAREEARSKGGNTWAAYQCYGDPDWRLRTGVADAQSPRRDLGDVYAGIASAPELALALETLAVGSKSDKRPAEQQLAAIGHLEGRFGASMGGIGAVAEAFAIAYDEAGNFDKAIEWYRRALEADDGLATMRAAERFGNLVARHAYARVRPKGDRRAGAQELTDTRNLALGALTHLEALARQRPSVERLSLVGSACKRLFMIEQLMGPSQAACAAMHLKGMGEAYTEAARLARAGQGGAWFYPAQNLLAAQVRLARLDERAPRPDAALRAEIAKHLKADRARDTEGWADVGLIEIDLHEALLAGDAASRLPAVMRRFVDLHERLPSPRLWSTLADQIDFLLGPPAARGAKEPWPVGMAALVEQVRGFATERG